MIGYRIAFLRRRMGMSQAELSGCLAVSPAAIGAYEQGRRLPSAAALVLLSRTLHVSVDYLLTGHPIDRQELAVAVEYAACTDEDSRHTLALQLLYMLTTDYKIG